MKLFWSTHLRLLTYLVFIIAAHWNLLCTAVASASGGAHAPWFWCLGGWGAWVLRVFSFNVLTLYCRDMMGWLSMEKVAFQDRKCLLILARDWGNRMSPVAAGCPRHLNRCKRWLAGLKLNPHGGFLGPGLKKGMILLNKIWFSWNGLTRHMKQKVLLGNAGLVVLVSDWCKSESWSPNSQFPSLVRKMHVLALGF